MKCVNFEASGTISKPQDIVDYIHEEKAYTETNAVYIVCSAGCYWDDKKDLLYEIKIGVGDRVAIEEEGLYLVKKDTLGPKAIKFLKLRKQNLVVLRLKYSTRMAAEGMIRIRSVSVPRQSCLRWSER